MVKILSFTSWNEHWVCSIHRSKQPWSCPNPCNIFRRNLHFIPKIEFFELRVSKWRYASYTAEWGAPGILEGQSGAKKGDPEVLVLLPALKGLVLTSVPRSPSKQERSVETMSEEKSLKELTSGCVPPKKKLVKYFKNSPDGCHQIKSRPISYKETQSSL